MKLSMILAIKLIELTIKDKTWVKVSSINICFKINLNNRIYEAAERRASYVQQSTLLGQRMG
jgi:hypothetical protein